MTFFPRVKNAPICKTLGWYPIWRGRWKLWCTDPIPPFEKFVFPVIKKVWPGLTR